MSIARRFRSQLRLWTRVAAVLGTLVGRVANGQEVAGRQVPDNGTDPSRLRRLTQLSYELLDPARGSARSTLQLIGGTPVLRHIALEATLPFVNTAEPATAGLGDVKLEVREILGRFRRTAHLLRGEVSFDTAHRPELGSGMPTFEAAYVYTRYLERGALFAPSLAQKTSIGEGQDGAFINETTLDLYVVPTHWNARDFVTMDVALRSDWEHGHGSAEVAVSAGRVVGAWLGAGAQLYVRPRFSVGADRAGWAIEAGSKLIRFGWPSSAGAAPPAGRGS
jgi:hypothetical protein